MSSVKRLSSLDITAFDDRFGQETTWPSGIVSFDNGARSEPVKPGHPYEAVSVNRCLAFGFFPLSKTCLNFGARGCDECRNT